MAAESNSSMGDRQLWSAWANKQGLEYSESEEEDENNEDEEKLYKERKKEDCYNMELPRKDMSLCGLRPAFEDIILVVCGFCETHVKKQSLLYHKIHHHKGEVYSNNDITNELTKPSVSNSSASNSASSQSAKNALKPSLKPRNRTSNNYSSGASNPSSSSGTRRCAKSKPKTAVSDSCDITNNGNCSSILNQVLKSIPTSWPLSSERLLAQQEIPCVGHVALFSDAYSSPTACSSNGQAFCSDSAKIEQRITSYDINIETYKSQQRTVKHKVVEKVYDPNKHCGVILETGIPCTRSLLTRCKDHTPSRRTVLGREKSLPQTMRDLRQQKKQMNVSFASADINTSRVVNSSASSFLQTYCDGSVDLMNSCDVESSKLATKSCKVQPLKKSVPKYINLTKTNALEEKKIPPHEIGIPVPVTTASDISTSTSIDPIGHSVAYILDLDNRKKSAYPTTVAPRVPPVTAVPVTAAATFTSVTVPSGADSKPVNSSPTCSRSDKSHTPSVHIKGIFQGLPTLKDLPQLYPLKNPETVKVENAVPDFSTDPPFEKHYPAPVAVCGFGLRHTSKGVVGYGRKFDRLQSALRNVAQSIASSVTISRPDIESSEISHPVVNKPVNTSIPCSSLCSSLSAVPTTTVPMLVQPSREAKSCTNMIPAHLQTASSKLPSPLLRDSQPKKHDTKPKAEEPPQALKADIKHCSKRKRNESGELQKSAHVFNSQPVTLSFAYAKPSNAFSPDGMDHAVMHSTITNNLADPLCSNIFKNRLLTNDGTRNGHISNANSSLSLVHPCAGLQLPHLNQFSASKTAQNYMGNCNVSYPFNLLVNSPSSQTIINTPINSETKCSQFDMRVSHAAMLPNTDLAYGTDNTSLHAASIDAASVSSIFNGTEHCVGPKSNCSSSGSLSPFSAEINSCSPQSTSSGQKAKQRKGYSKSPRKDSSHYNRIWKMY